MDPFFFEIHKDLPREGPGGDVHTWRALAAIRAELPDKPVVLDIGCGPGRQTIALAHYLPGAAVHAIDTHQPYLDTPLGCWPGTGSPTGSISPTSPWMPCPSRRASSI
jgi:SAM-dependent methyltransferase